MKLFGSILDLLEDAGPLAVAELLSPKPPVSIKFRDAMMVSMTQSWKRSTTSAQVIWKRFSLSILLKTVDLISTN